MNIKETPLTGLIIIEPKVFNDNRGYFYESYQQERYSQLGIPAFIQDNVSHSKQSVLRGMHYQLPNAQGKLVGVSRGSVWDVVIDIRQKSATFGQWFGLKLDAESGTQLYIPPGFAHGFCVLSPEADFYYKCTALYSPESELGIRWDDKDINIAWPIANPILAPKDMAYPSLSDLSNEKLFA